jgi:hypothetical protein
VPEIRYSAVPHHSPTPSHDAFAALPTAPQRDLEQGTGDHLQARNSIRTVSSLETLVTPHLVAEAKEQRHQERQLTILEEIRRVETQIIAIQDRVMAQDQANGEGDPRPSSAQSEIEKELRGAKKSLRILKAAQQSSWGQGTSDEFPTHSGQSSIS